jgi:hypothetical protein
MIIIIMHNNRYKTVNTFSRSFNFNQVLALLVVIALFVDYFAAVQSNMQDGGKRVGLTVLFSLSFGVLVASTIVCCVTDPVDSIVPIYLSNDRSSLSKELHKCLYC